MADHLNSKDKWGFFWATFVFWLVIPLPLWLLGVGFGGEIFLLPSFDLFSAGEGWLWIGFVLFFYGPLLLMGAQLVDLLRGPSGRRDNGDDA